MDVIGATSASLLFVLLVVFVALVLPTAVGLLLEASAGQR